MSRFGWDKVGTRNSLMAQGAELMEKAAAAIARVRELHTPCGCDCFDIKPHKPECVECGQAYPCATIRTLEG